MAAGLLAWASGLQGAGHGEEGERAAAALDPRAALMGPFRVGRVVACLLGGAEEAAGGGEAEEEVQLPGMPGLPALRVSWLGVGCGVGQREEEVLAACTAGEKQSVESWLPPGASFSGSGGHPEFPRVHTCVRASMRALCPR